MVGPGGRERPALKDLVQESAWERTVYPNGAAHRSVAFLPPYIVLKPAQVPLYQVVLCGASAACLIGVLEVVHGFQWASLIASGDGFG